MKKEQIKEQSTETMTYEQWIKEHHSYYGPMIVKQCLEKYPRIMEWGKVKKDGS